MTYSLTLRRAWLLLATLLLATGCSLIFDGAGVVDEAGRTDAGPTDAGRTDAGTADASPEDAGADAGAEDAGPPPCIQPCDCDDDGSPNETCDPPSGTVLDCDDTNPLVFPGAPPVCGDAVLNDCNEQTRAGGDPPTLSSLLGTDVELSAVVVTDLTVPDADGRFEVAVTPRGAEPPTLAVLVGQSSGVGATLVTSELGSETIRTNPLNDACLTTPATAMGVATLGPDRVGVTLARSASGAASSWYQSLTVMGGSSDSSTVDLGPCEPTAQLVDSIAAVTLVDSDAASPALPVPGVYVYAETDDSGCLAVGGGGCNTVDFDPGAQALGVDGMMLVPIDNTSVGAGHSVEAIFVDGSTDQFASSLDGVSGRFAAANVGGSAILVYPDDTTLRALRRSCADPRCQALGASDLVSTFYSGILPASEPRLSVAAAWDNRFVYASRRAANPGGIALNVLPRTGPPVFVPTLNFPGRTLVDLAVRSVPDEDSQVFVVVAFTTEPAGDPGEYNMHHATLRAYIER